MRGHWLQRTGQADCILFMAGWGMAPAPFATIPCHGHDLLMLYDYRDLEVPDLSPLKNYRQCHLIAWSMGVWAASLLPAPVRSRFAQATAMGGTLHPMDDRLGIPVAAFDATVKALDSDALAAFHRSMFDEEEETERFLAHAPRRSAGELRSELAGLRAACRRQGPGRDIFTLRIITSRDRIVPARNQLRAWGRTATVTRRWPHFPFYRIPAWHTLLREDAVDRK